MYLHYLIQRHICALVGGPLLFRLSFAVEMGICLVLLDCWQQTVFGGSEVEVRDERGEHDDIKAESRPRIEARVNVELTLKLVKHRLY